MLITFIGPGGSAVDQFAVQIYDLTVDPDTEISEADFVGDHGVVALNLAADQYELDVVAFSGAALASNVHYKIKVQTDNPATRCPAGSGTATYTESHDGGSNVGNDLWAYQSDGMGGISEGPIAVASSTAEPTGVTVGAATNYLLAGSAGTQPVGTMVDSGPPAYLDNDSYSISTGATTDQMEIQLNWDFRRLRMISTGT